jgi:6,7-dimethyl-8-ribityllumazine synthase
LGCVIKGGTPHFEYVCQAVTQGITLLNNTLNIPIIFGVLTVDYKDQAMARIQNGREGDKGMEAALTAIKMIAFNQLEM